MRARRLRLSHAVWLAASRWAPYLSTADLRPGRNMLGGIFPLLTHAMFARMRFAGALSFLGGVVSRPRV